MHSACGSDVDCGFVDIIAPAPASVLLPKVVLVVLKYIAGTAYPAILNDIRDAVRRGETLNTDVKT
jgi:hypothetical protein